MSLQFVSALEQGAKTASLEKIDALCAALRVKPSELFAAGEEATRPKDAASRDVVRAATALPAEREKDVLELLHVVSRMLSKAPRARTTSTSPRKAKRT
jgi:transcriptional regulator with XRE-family HTH domain